MPHTYRSQSTIHNPQSLRSGSPLDPECPPEAVKLAADAAAYLVIDTNVALHQLDFLEHPAVTDVIVTKTVLEEVGSDLAVIWV